MSFNNFFRFILKYFKSSPSPFQSRSASEPPVKKSKSDVKFKISELDLCEATYNLLRAAPDYFKEQWNWSYFIEKYSNHPNYEIRWIVCQSVAILNGMTETDTHKMILQTISEEEDRKLCLKYLSPIERQSINQTIKNDVTFIDPFSANLLF